MIKKIIFAAFLFSIISLVGFSKEAHAEPVLPAGFSDQLITAGLSLPTDFAFAPSADGRIFITLKNGQVVIFKNNQLLSTPALNMSVSTGGDRGILSLSLDPNFFSNKFVYLLYTTTSNHQRISRFTVTGDTISSASETVLLENPTVWGGFLNAGMIRFGPDGKLYGSFGSNGGGSVSQDLSSLDGKFVRINSDGSVPSDNPFFATAGAQRSIYAYGLRNPWRFNFAPDGKAILGDVGEEFFEKIVRIERGANYGWPNFEGDCRPNCGGVTPPIHVYPHNGQGASVVGGAVYTGSAFPANYQNNYFFGDYVQGYIKNIVFDGSGNVASVNNFGSGLGTLAGINMGLDGCLYYLDIFPGELHKICNATAQQPVANASSDKTFGNLPLAVQFSSTGSSDPLGGTLNYLWNFGDGSSSTAANPTHTYSTRGVYSVTLRVTNSAGSTNDSLTIWAGYLPPSATISTPAAGSHYSGGQSIAYSGTATDPQDGSLSASAFFWKIIFHHNTHIHPGDEFPGVMRGTYTIPTELHSPALDVSYEFQLTVTNGVGLSTTTSRFITPNLMNLRIETNPPSFGLLLDSQPISTPHVVQAIPGFTRTLSAPSPQVLGGVSYNFSSWSDGGTQTHSVSLPATDTTYVANYVQGPPAPPPTQFISNVTTDQPNYSSGNPVMITATVTSPSDLSNALIDLELYSGTTKLNQKVTSPVSFTAGQAMTVIWKPNAPATTGTYVIKIGVFSSSWKQLYYWNDNAASFTVGTTPPPPPATCTVGTNQFVGCYYDNQDFSNLKVVRTDPVINFDWVGGSPDPSIGADSFSVRWQGNFNFDSAPYAFTVTADDGFRLYLDGVVVLDKFIDQPATTYTVNKTMTGGAHAVRMDYYENGGNAVAKLSWAKINQPPPAPAFVVSASMPASNFAPGAATTINTAVTATSDLPNVVVHTEIYDSNSTKVSGDIKSTNLLANQQFNSNWQVSLPAVNGVYIVKIGIFSADYGQLYFWKNDAFRFTIGSPPGPPVPGQNYPVTVIVPQDNADVSGLVEIKSVVTGLDINTYNIGWRSGSGPLFNLDTDPVTQSFKHAWIDFGPWTWIPSNIYPLEFQATDQSGNIIGSTLIHVHVVH